MGIPGNFAYGSKDASENSTSFDARDIPTAGRRKKLVKEKLAKNRILRGLKLPGSGQNRMSIPYKTISFIHENGERNKITKSSDFHIPPSHIGAAYAFSNFLKNFQNQIPKVLD